MAVCDISAMLDISDILVSEQTDAVEYINGQQKCYGFT